MFGNNIYRHIRTCGQSIMIQNRKEQHRQNKTDRTSAFETESLLTYITARLLNYRIQILKRV